jgi:hypothetical protein
VTRRPYRAATSTQVSKAVCSRLAVGLDVPADRAAARQPPRLAQRVPLRVLPDLPVGVALRPAGLADVEGDLVREVAVAGVEIDVVGDQELPRADHYRAGARQEGRRPVVGRPLGLLQLLGPRLVLADADVGEGPARRARGGVLVEIDRDAELITDAFAQPMRERGAIFHRDARDRHERDHVGRALARVGAGVAGHVDTLGGAADQPEGGSCRPRGRRRAG